MAKKQKKATPKRVPTKRQLSKWQRQMKIRRIVIIAAVVFLVGISSWVGYEYYKDYKSDPLRQVVIEVNDAPFTMEYYVNALEIYVNNYINTYGDFYMRAYNITSEEAIQLLTSNLRQNTNNIADMITDQVADEIINSELVRQGAKKLGIELTSEEIDAGLEEYGLPNDTVYRDMIGAALLQEKLGEYFGPGLNATMEQAHVQVMLVESQEAADEVITKVEAGGNFTALAEEFSCNFTVEGDLGWLPEELMPNTLIADAAFNITPGEIRPVYEETAIKNIGYWLIEVTNAQNETIDAQVMLLPSEARAQQIRGELAAGGNFSALAMEYSQHESKTKGGRLNGLKQGDMGSTAFDEVAFNITPNVVSEPVKDVSVQTTGGYWLVKVVDRGDHELEDEVREKLINKRFNDWLEERSEESTIEIYLDAEKKQWAVSQVLAGR